MFSLDKEWSALRLKLEVKSENSEVEQNSTIMV